MADTAQSCVEADLFNSGSVEIKPGRDVSIASTANWCNEPDLPVYRGPIPPNAKEVFIEFNDFGPFTGFAVETVP
jgi:hypothetical protein